MNSPKDNLKNVSENKRDLFEDLRSRNISDVKNELRLLDNEINELSERFDTLGKELENATNLELLLADIMDNDDYKLKSKEAKHLAGELKKTHNEISDLQTKRNLINENVGLPSHQCENELLRVYERLTGEVDIFKVPSIQKEEEWFSYFFELQEMYKLMVEADQAHKKVGELFKTQQDNFTQLKSLNSEISATFDSVIQDESILEGVQLNYSSLIEIRKSIYNLKRVRSKCFKLRKTARRERGRLQAYVKHLEKPKSKGKPKARTGPSTHEVKEKVSSGGSLSLQELDVFLKSGGLKNLPSQQSNTSNLTRKKKNQKSSVQVARGKPAKSTKGMKD
ncbi:MAG: hypothetical protein O2866_06055 [archaeon]|nr:hypothetical protein [archaeon]MDA0842769.1 hypothetical protein [archaeon]MDA1168428.1 hypothetical protein [archaeon]